MKQAKIQEQDDSVIGAVEAAEILRVKLTTFYGMVKRGEVPPARRHVEGEPYEFDRDTIIELAETLKPKRLARDGSTRGRPRVNPENETVRAFGRATPEEVERWTRAAGKRHGGKVWPWLRELANKASAKSGA